MKKDREGEGGLNLCMKNYAADFVLSCIASFVTKLFLHLSNLTAFDLFLNIERHHLSGKSKFAKIQFVHNSPFEAQRPS